MHLSRIDLNEEQLQENYNYWLSKWTPLKHPNNEFERMVERIFPTHTFPYLKSILNKEGVLIEKVRPYKSILSISKPEGLLSDGLRELRNHYRNGEVKRSMETARKVGLNNYVFAYLGLHELYYGVDLKKNPDPPDLRPFGLFIRPEIELFPNCLPTRRDLNSLNHVDMQGVMKEFLHPKKARSYLTYQVLNDPAHQGDFWHYYGSPDYLTEGLETEYWQNAWKKKVEFHYFEGVSVDNIRAILWPIWYSDVKPSKNKGVYEFEWSDTYYDLEIFRRKYSEISIIPYQIDDTDNAAAFIEASFYSIRYFLMHDVFPINAEQAKSEFNGKK